MREKAVVDDVISLCC